MKRSIFVLTLFLLAASLLAVTISAYFIPFPGTEILTVTKEGEPVGGAQFSLYRQNQFGGEDIPLGTYTTDTNGKITAGHLTTGSYYWTDSSRVVKKVFLVTGAGVVRTEIALPAPISNLLAFDWRDITVEKDGGSEMVQSLFDKTFSEKTEDETVQIKLLGDSITHGVGGTGFEQNGEAITAGFARNPDGYCWANHFKQHLEATLPCRVINNACTGTKIEFVIDRFEELVSPEDDLVLCIIGTNNRHQYFSEGSKKTREIMTEDFSRNIEILYGKFQAAGIPVIFVANIPASEENEKDGEDYWRILHMQDIHDLYASAAEKLEFPLIDLFSLWNGYCAKNGIDPDSLLSDGLHPNDLGEDVIFALMMKALGIAS